MNQARKNRILFVDDEPAVLTGLRNMLRKRRKAWDMHFAPGGQETVECLSVSTFDILVTDMRMPRLDGAKLLQIAHQDYPRMARVVLSGFADAEATNCSREYADEVLSKPCDPQLLQATIERLHKSPHR